jgi:hypothetical protein
MSEELQDIAKQIAELNLQWQSERNSALGVAPPEPSQQSQQQPAEATRFATFTAQDAPSSFYNPRPSPPPIPTSNPASFPAESMSMATVVSAAASSHRPVSPASASIRRPVPPVPVSNQTPQSAEMSKRLAAIKNNKITGARPKAPEYTIDIALLFDLTGSVCLGCL